MFFNMFSDLNEIERACRSCEACSLGLTRTKLVFGVGNENADIMFVGEGPGENEDLKGEPFVGAAGKLLDKYLKVFGFDRSKNIYIANIVKCRPPKNRDPLPEEQESCIKWLRAQTRAVNPKIIVCLGRVAATRLISPDFSVTRQHGQFIKKGNIYFMGTFHPAALLRNEDNKEAALSDFAALKEKAVLLGCGIN